MTTDTLEAKRNEIQEQFNAVKKQLEQINTLRPQLEALGGALQMLDILIAADKQPAEEV